MTNYCQSLFYRLIFELKLDCVLRCRNFPVESDSSHFRYKIIGLIAVIFTWMHHIGYECLSIQFTYDWPQYSIQHLSKLVAFWIHRYFRLFTANDKLENSCFSYISYRILFGICVKVAVQCTLLHCTQYSQWLIYAKWKVALSISWILEHESNHFYRGFSQSFFPWIFLSVIFSPNWRLIYKFLPTSTRSDQSYLLFGNNFDDNLKLHSINHEKNAGVSVHITQYSLCDAHRKWKFFTVKRVFLLWIFCFLKECRNEAHLQIRTCANHGVRDEQTKIWIPLAVKRVEHWLACQDWKPNQVLVSYNEANHWTIATNKKKQENKKKIKPNPCRISVMLSKLVFI